MKRKPSGSLRSDSSGQIVLLKDEAGQYFVRIAPIARGYDAGSRQAVADGKTEDSRKFLLVGNIAAGSETITGASSADEEKKRRQAVPANRPPVDSARVGRLFFDNLDVRMQGF